MGKPSLTVVIIVRERKWLLYLSVRTTEEERYREDKEEGSRIIQVKC